MNGKIYESFNDWWQSIEDDEYQKKYRGYSILCSNVWNVRQPEIDSLGKKVKILTDSLNNLIFHFQDYGLEEESFVLLMEVEKARSDLKRCEELAKE